MVDGSSTSTVACFSSCESHFLLHFGSSFLLELAKPANWQLTRKIGSVFRAFLVRIFPHSDRIGSICPHSVQMRKNTDQKNSEYGHFLRRFYYIGKNAIHFNVPFISVFLVAQKSCILILGK